MQLGMIGLGRMGASMVRRLMNHGHACIVHDTRPDAMAPLCKLGAAGTTSMAELVQTMDPPRAIWLMVPAAVVDSALDALTLHLEPGDIVIDGGNSYYRDDIDRAQKMAVAGAHYVDVGTSGGVVGETRGYCLMIGGENGVVAHLEPIFASLAPASARQHAPADAAVRPGRPSRDFCTAARPALVIS
ncbi:MAG: NAD(P)-binding domain-containing protein [Salinisphaera sp.]